MSEQSVETTDRATTWTLDPTHSTVGFSAKHMVFTTVRGRFADVKGTVTIDRERPEASVAEIEIEAASIDTGVEQRDQHLRSDDFLDVENHPAITFRSKRVEDASLEEGARFTLTGDLTIRGVTREVRLDVTYLGEGADPWGGRRVGLQAVTTIDRRDFGLTWNQALEAGGLLVSNEVKIEIEVQAT